MDLILALVCHTRSYIENIINFYYPSCYKCLFLFISPPLWTHGWWRLLLEQKWSWERTLSECWKVTQVPLGPSDALAATRSSLKSQFYCQRMLDNWIMTVIVLNAAVEWFMITKVLQLVVKCTSIFHNKFS